MSPTQRPAVRLASVSTSLLFWLLKSSRLYAPWGGVWGRATQKLQLIRSSSPPWGQRPPSGRREGGPDGSCCRSPFRTSPPPRPKPGSGTQAPTMEVGVEKRRSFLGCSGHRLPAPTAHWGLGQAIQAGRSPAGCARAKAKPFRGGPNGPAHIAPIQEGFITVPAPEGELDPEDRATQGTERLRGPSDSGTERLRDRMTQRTERPRGPNDSGDQATQRTERLMGPNDPEDRATQKTVLKGCGAL